MKKINRFFIVALLVFALSGCSSSDQETSDAEKVRTEQDITPTEEVKTQDSEVTPTENVKEPDITPTEAGKVDEHEPAPGDEVKETESDGEIIPTEAVDDELFEETIPDEYISSYEFPGFFDTKYYQWFFYGNKENLFSGALGFSDRYIYAGELNSIMAELYYKAGEGVWCEDSWNRKSYDITMAFGKMNSYQSIYPGRLYYSNFRDSFPYEMRLLLCICKGSDLKDYYDNYQFCFFYFNPEVTIDDIDPDGYYYIVTDEATREETMKVVDIMYYDTYPRDLLAEYFMNNRNYDVLGNYFLDYPEDFPIIDSSTARKPITEELYHYFMGYEATERAPLCSKTHGAWLNLADGNADFVFLVKPTEEEEDYFREKQVDIECKLYGCDGLAFIVSPEAPVKDLTSQQIKDIYEGRITNWSEVGGPDHEIHPFVRDSQSGSQRLFESIMWPDGNVPAFVSNLGDENEYIFTEYGDMGEVTEATIADPYAIGYNIVSYLNNEFLEKIDLVTVDGAYPDAEHFADQSYFFTTKAYVAIRADEPENSPARRLFEWVGSEQFDRLVSDNSSLSIVHGEVEYLKYTE